MGTLHGQTKEPQAKTNYGIVEGVREQSGILSFKGIPFAAPPVGDFRWREPQPLKKWEGVLQTKKIWTPCYASTHFW